MTHEISSQKEKSLEMHENTIYIFMGHESLISWVFHDL